MKTEEIVALDRAHVWHPFTPHAVWLDPAYQPVVISSAEGSVLTDTEGRTYLDGNSSIWTNLHGHRHPQIHHAIQQQLDRLAHCSFLGLTHTEAPPLAERLCRMTGLDRCFFSDDGSTAMETALKVIIQYFYQNGQPERTRIVSLSGGYHGDTVGAMSMGHSPLFHRTYGSLMFPSTEAPAPSCYRCPHNRARPQQVDARAARQCSWECVDDFAVAMAGKPNEAPPAAVVIEPRVQGAAGFLMHPHGYLEKIEPLIRESGAQWVVDEVMTGFNRSGPRFAFQSESVQPDVVALAKGLTGGTLPLAATLFTENLFKGFAGSIERTFFHGHSYSGNPLGCAAARASLDVLESHENARARQTLEQALESVGVRFWSHPNVGDVRQEGCILAIELVADFVTRQRFDYAERIGARVCEAASRRGLLTRPVADVLVLMPPYSTTPHQVEQMGGALWDALCETLPLDLAR